MKFVCLRHVDATTWQTLPEVDKKALQNRCCVYRDELRRGGHLLEGGTLQGTGAGVMLSCCNGQVAVTDEPNEAPGESLGEVLLVEARDLNHAIALMERHPGIRVGAVEIRPLDRSIAPAESAAKT